MSLTSCFEVPLSQHEHHAKHHHMRQRLAQLAARLMAEDGMLDFASAKRKAARQLGAPDTQNLPANGEVERELRTWQHLYQKDEQTERIHILRREALDVMHLLQAFNPHLAGAVLSGAATRQAPIELHLFADSSKEVELFLLNHHTPYEATAKRFDFGAETREIPLLVVQGTHTEIELAVFSMNELRQAPRSPVNGKSMERAKAPQVEALIEAR
jgi:hypothetical protein